MVSLAATPAAAQETAPASPSADAPQSAPSPAPAAGDIVVTGVRAGLRSAISEKRNADNFSDVVKAEDIGQLPDSSVADSLQRITGVQIVRNSGASRETLAGQPVSIRGLPSLSIINGRTLLSGDTSRDVDFRTFSSAEFGELVISKSPTADRIEGGLGGTIELETRNPLNFNKPVISFTAQGNYLEYAKSTNPDLSGFYADKFAGGRIGIVLSGYYSHTKTRQDQFLARGGWVVENGYTGSGHDFDGNGVADLIVPSDLRINYGGDVQERIGGDGALTFAATDTLTLKLDGTYSKFNRSFFNGVLRSANNGAANLVPGSATVDNGTLLAATYRNQLIQADGRLEIDNVTAYTYGFNAKWEHDRWHGNFDVAQSAGGEDGIQYINRYELFQPATVKWDFTGPSEVPDIIVNNGANLSDRSLYRVDLTFANTDKTRNREFSTRADLSYDLDGFFDKLSVGGRYTNARFKLVHFDQNNQSNNVNNPVVYDPVTHQRLSAANPALDPLFEGFPVDNIFAGVGGSFPRSWLYTSYPGASLNDAGAYGNIYGLDAAGKTEALGSRTDIGERTIAGYVRADFKGSIGSMDLRGNFGVRVVGTQVNSVAFQTQQSGAGAFVPESNSYVDVLPSATLVLSIKPNLLFRLAAGRVMRRPDLTQLRSSLTADLSSLNASAGNIDLKPFRANQIDAALEWYFSKDGLLSGTVFYKDVSNFIASTTQTNVNIGLVGFDGGTLFTLTRPVNAGTAKIKGAEVSYQQAFTFLPGPLKHLGLISNYTFTDATTSSGQSFPELSRHVVNVIGYYDDGTFDTRIAYNWRSKYASTGDGTNGLQFLNIDEYVAAGGQLDASAHYKLTKNFSLTFDVLNITKAHFLRYTGIEERVRDYRSAERTFSFGVRAKF
ncbi:MAG: TonB-dependent receptor [Sphingomonas sp.]|uniref:TonB-dependent receptor n=1 Tax=Sphingomonas sp. TaxID=28214 RepID=UPI003F8033D8